jgi:splicing factor 3B subunit 3
VPGGADALLYSTVMGGLGALIPFASREDVDFFSHLELSMRQECPPLLGRDQLAYRGYFIPVKECIDGDLCEMFTSLPLEQQKKIAEELERTPGEVAKKLEDVRSRLM